VIKFQKHSRLRATLSYIYHMIWYSSYVSIYRIYVKRFILCAWWFFTRYLCSHCFFWGHFMLAFCPTIYSTCVWPTKKKGKQWWYFIIFMQIIIILTYEFYIYICGEKKAGAKLFGYKPLEKRFPPYTYTYIHFIHFLSPLLRHTVANLFIFLPHCVYIYIYMCISVCGCVYVRERAFSFFQFIVYRKLNRILCVCMRDHSAQ